jgi:hypothetical protein
MGQSAANKIEQVFGRNEGALQEENKTPDQTTKTTIKPKIELKQPQIRRLGTGCVYQISNYLWEGSYSLRLPNVKRKKIQCLC